jgi:DNA primase
MKSTVDELLSRINILDVVSQYVKLRRTGKNYIGLCPFHKEKTASFSVSTEKQIYYCFGCQEGGNAINFVMKYENLSFQDALENLARQYGVEIARRTDRKRANSFEALQKLSDYYHRALKESRTALQYLLDRGIDGGAVDEFKIGFSDRARQRLEMFLSKADIPNDILLSTGVLRIRDGRVYDIFAGRIVIPIRDANGKVVGFGGRTMEKDALPKYINSPESPVFSKGSSLFGIDKTRKAIAEQGEAFVVEGYFDLITLYMSGFRNVVSTLGTSVTEGQLARLRNYTDNITLMLDGDEAGVRSALRLIGSFCDMDINGNIVMLPPGHDPDSLIRTEGAEGLLRVVEKKKPILDHLFDYHVDRCGIKKLEGKIAFIKSVKPYVEGIKDGIKKRLYVKRLSELTGVEEHQFWDSGRETTIGQPVVGDDLPSIIGKRVVRVLIEKPELLEILRTKGVMRYIGDSDLKEVLLKMFELLERGGELELNSFINVLEKEELRRFVLDASFDVLDSGEDEPERIVSDYVRHIEKKAGQESLKRITERLSVAEQRGDEKEILSLLQEKRHALASIKSNLFK